MQISHYYKIKHIANGLIYSFFLNRISYLVSQIQESEQFFI